MLRRSADHRLAQQRLDALSGRGSGRRPTPVMMTSASAPSMQAVGVARRIRRHPARRARASCLRGRRRGCAAPASCSAVMMAIDGASRMSSVFGLEGEAEHGDGAAAHAAAAGGDDLARHGALALLVDGDDGLDRADRRAEVMRRCCSSASSVLGEARAAIAGAGVEELRRRCGCRGRCRAPPPARRRRPARTGRRSR